jgi:predicted DNA-binding transcriptional regulator AlpA
MTSQANAKDKQRELTQAAREALSELPPELGRHRVLNTNETCQFVNVSAPNWRRLVRNGVAPQPIRVGTRKVGWRIGELINWLEARAERPTAA